MIFLAVITEYSFNQTATRSISVNRDNMEKVSAIFSRVFFSRIVLCGFTFVLLVLLMVLVPFFQARPLLYSSAFLFVIGYSSMINWFFLGIEKMHFITWITLVARLVFAALVFAFIRGRDDGYLFIFFLGLGNLVGAAISIFIAIRHYRVKIKVPALKEIVIELREGWQLTLSHIANSTCHYSNIFILRLFANDLIVGYYGIAERIFFTIKQVYVVYSQAVYPRLCLLLQQGKERAGLFLKRNFRGFFILVVVGALALYIFSPVVLSFFIGPAYSHAVPLLRGFSVIAIIVCLNIPGTLLLLATNQNSKYLKVYLSAAILNVVLNIVLAKYYYATGTLIAILSTEFFITIAVTWFARKSNEPGDKRPRNLPESVEF